MHLYLSITTLVKIASVLPSSPVSGKKEFFYVFCNIVVSQTRPTSDPT